MKYDPIHPSVNLHPTDLEPFASPSQLCRMVFFQNMILVHRIPILLKENKMLLTQKSLPKNSNRGWDNAKTIITSKTEKNHF